MRHSSKQAKRAFIVAKLTTFLCILLAFNTTASATETDYQLQKGQIFNGDIAYHGGGGTIWKYQVQVTSVAGQDISIIYDFERWDGYGGGNLQSKGSIFLQGTLAPATGKIAFTTRKQLEGAELSGYVLNSPLLCSVSENADQFTLNDEPYTNRFNQPAYLTIAKLNVEKTAIYQTPQPIRVHTSYTGTISHEKKLWGDTTGVNVFVTKVGRPDKRGLKFPVETAIIISTGDVQHIYGAHGYSQLDTMELTLTDIDPFHRPLVVKLLENNLSNTHFSPLTIKATITDTGNTLNATFPTLGNTVLERNNQIMNVKKELDAILKKENHRAINYAEERINNWRKIRNNSEVKAVLEFKKIKPDFTECINSIKRTKGKELQVQDVDDCRFSFNKAFNQAEQLKKKEESLLNIWKEWIVVPGNKALYDYRPFLSLKKGVQQLKQRRKNTYTITDLDAVLSECNKQIRHNKRLIQTAKDLKEKEKEIADSWNQWVADPKNRSLYDYRPFPSVQDEIRQLKKQKEDTYTIADLDTILAETNKQINHSQQLRDQEQKEKLAAERRRQAEAKLSNRKASALIAFGGTLRLADKNTPKVVEQALLKRSHGKLIAQNLNYLGTRVDMYEMAANYGQSKYGYAVFVKGLFSPKLAFFALPRIRKHRIEGMSGIGKAFEFMTGASENETANEITKTYGPPNINQQNLWTFDGGKTAIAVATCDNETLKGLCSLNMKSRGASNQDTDLVIYSNEFLFGKWIQQVKTSGSGFEANPY